MIALVFAVFLDFAMDASFRYPYSLHASQPISLRPG
jgi:hypothetical protein